MPASANSTVSLEDRVTSTLAVMTKLTADGFKVAGIVMGQAEGILILEFTPRCRKLLGSVRRIFRDHTGQNLELEIVINNVRVRWIQPYFPPVPAQGIH